jgi:hypothetical protein
MSFTTASPLSLIEVKELLEPGINVIPYETISTYTNIDELLGDNKCAIILHQIRRKNGHWVAVFARNDALHYFDSYGNKPDQIIPKEEELHENFGDLTKLMIESPYKRICYNKYPFQEISPEINTCGPHCIMRLYFRELGDFNYKKLLDNLLEETDTNDYDDLVVNFVNNIN